MPRMKVQSDHAASHVRGKLVVFDKDRFLARGGELTEDAIVAEDGHLEVDEEIANVLAETRQARHAPKPEAKAPPEPHEEHVKPAEPHESNDESKSLWMPGESEDDAALPKAARRRSKPDEENV